MYTSSLYLALIPVDFSFKFIYRNIYYRSTNYVCHAFSTLLNTCWEYFPLRLRHNGITLWISPKFMRNASLSFSLFLSFMDFLAVPHWRQSSKCQAQTRRNDALESAKSSLQTEFKGSTSPNETIEASDSRLMKPSSRGFPGRLNVSVVWGRAEAGREGRGEADERPKGQRQLTAVRSHIWTSAPTPFDY